MPKEFKLSDYKITINLIVNGKPEKAVLFNQIHVKQFIEEILKEIETGFFMESPAGYKLKAVEEIKQIIKQKAGELDGNK